MSFVTLTIFKLTQYYGEMHFELSRTYEHRQKNMSRYSLTGRVNKNNIPVRSTNPGRYILPMMSPLKALTIGLN